MKKIIFILIFGFSFQCLKAQYALRIIVDSVATKKGEDIYVAGSFNSWNPHDYNYKLKPFGTTRRGIVLKDIAAGKYEFKLTRGTDKWETTAKGDDIPNREVTVNEDITVNCKVEGWKDDFPDKPKPFTATAQISIIDTAFAIPQLNRTRRVWIYLPKGYAAAKKKYPVIYMHDGQNLFNEQTASFGEWGVDEALDSLQQRTGKEAIIVGIDHGGSTRINEYSPYDMQKYGKGEGSKYVDFIVTTLKPYIDNKYKTLKDSNNTYIAGSSLGGSISLYALAKYPDVFAGAGIFSPAFWTTPALYDEVDKARWSTKKKIFFYAGGKESDDMIPDMERMVEVLQKKGSYAIKKIVSPLGNHNEKAWREEFPEFYVFILN